MSRWPVWAAAPERASDTTGCSRLARGPRLPARPCLQVPLDCGQGGRAGSWCLGPRSVRTTLVIGGFTLVFGRFPVRKGPLVAQKNAITVSPDRLADGHKSFIPKRLGCVP